MKYFEVEFTTAVRNGDNKNGHWYNLYEAKTETEAVDMLMKEMAEHRIEVVKVIGVVEALIGEVPTVCGGIYSEE